MDEFLLKIIAGEATFADQSGYVFPEFKEENTEIIQKAENYTSLLDNEISVGEVYFTGTRIIVLLALVHFLKNDACDLHL